MSNLRKELNKYNQDRDQKINEAAYAWAEKNIILINEKIDRRNVKRLSDAILKFDEKFGPYKDKIPALAAQLETAESNLQLVLTGRVDDSSASDMLQQLSYLYKTFSDFFGTDLPILLNTGIFTAAKQNPDVRLDSLQPGEGAVGHDPKMIKDTFRHSIEPSKDELKLIRKIYRKRNMPLVDSIGIANQLLSLSYNELQNLSSVEKIPMVATEEEPVQESMDLNENILHEVDLQKLKTLNADMDKLDKVFQPFAKKLPSLDALLDQLRGQVLQIQNGGKSGAWDKVKSLFGGGVEKNILATHDLFRDFKQIAQEVVKLMKGAQPNVPLQSLTSDEKFGRHAQNAINLLGKSVKPGLFGKSSIDPKTFQNEISGLTLSEIDSLARGINLAPTQEVNPNLDNPAPEQTSEPADPYQVGDVNLQKSPTNSQNGNPAFAGFPGMDANGVPLQYDSNGQPITNNQQPTAPLAPQNSRKRGPAEPIDLNTGDGQGTQGTENTPAPADATTTAAPGTQQPAQPGQTVPDQQTQSEPVTPGGNLTGDDIIADVLTKKKISKNMQNDIKAAADWLGKNGFKITK